MRQNIVFIPRSAQKGLLCVRARGWTFTLAVIPSTVTPVSAVAHQLTSPSTYPAGETPVPQEVAWPSEGFCGQPSRLPGARFLFSSQIPQPTRCARSLGMTHRSDRREKENPSVEEGFRVGLSSAYQRSSSRSPRLPPRLPRPPPPPVRSFA